jgi:hypothetical protein
LEKNGKIPIKLIIDNPEFFAFFAVNLSVFARTSEKVGGA